MNNIHESVNALSSWSTAQQARRTDFARPEGKIRLTREGQLEFIAQPGIWDKMKEKVGWGGWSSQRVLSFLQENYDRIAQANPAALHELHEFAAQTYWKNRGENTRVADACLPILQRETLSLPFLARGTGIDVPQQFSAYYLHTQALADANAFGAIAAHNGYREATVPANATPEQRQLVDRYNNAARSALLCLRNRTGSRLEDSFQKPKYNTPDFDVARDVVGRFGTHECPLMMAVLQEKLSKEYGGNEPPSLSWLMTGIFELSNGQERLKMIRSLGRNDFLTPPGELNPQGRARVISGLEMYCERQVRMGYKERLRGELEALQQPLSNPTNPLEQEMRQAIVRELKKLT